MSDKITALYMRLSQEDERDGVSLSIENQEKILMEYAESQKFVNIRKFYDDGASGTTTNRKGFRELEREVDNGNIGLILVKDCSRLSRNIVDITLFLEKLQEKNIRFISVSENEDSDKGLSDMVMFKSLFNEFYARDTSRKIRAIVANQAKNGKRVNGQFPYGYIPNPENKHQLIVDPDTIGVVKNIFDMYNSGWRIAEIQRWLRENKVLRAEALRHKRANTAYPDDPYYWSGKSITDILQRKEYLGDTYTHKSHKLSYKSKKAVKHDESEWYFFPNTHEPLIDKYTFEQAQKRYNDRYRATKKSGKIDKYSGILFCGDCKNKMYTAQSDSLTLNKHNYNCATYRSTVNKSNTLCTMHYIRLIVLDEIVLSEINRVLTEIKTDKQQFLNNAIKTAENKRNSENKKNQKDYLKAKNRLVELEKVFNKLYEDMALGKISEEKFNSLTANFDTENDELKQFISDFEEDKTALEKQKQDITKFVKIVDKYTEITELNYEILHELISRINIFEVDPETKTRKIEIIFNFIGNLPFADTALSYNVPYTKRKTALSVV